MAELWPRGLADNIWAVVDFARDERIREVVEASNLDKSCLFRGRADEALKRAAPHLVRLEYNHPFTRQLIDEGWGHHWGVFLQADASLEELRLHLKSLLRVQDERGRRLMFRFYDPRVLRVYLPTCTAKELRIVCGFIARFVTEGEDSGTLITFLYEAGKLIERQLPLSGEEALVKERVFPQSAVVR